MSKSRKRKKKNRPSTGSRVNTPQVHAKVAYAENDFREAAALIKPALLYADRVTLHSPSASLLKAAFSLGEPNSPLDRLNMILAIVDQVPSMGLQLQVPPDTLAQMKMFMAIDPRLVRQVARRSGSGAEIESLYDKLSEWDSIWDEQIPAVLHQIEEQFGATELLEAMKSGFLEIAPIGTASNTDHVASTLRAATGEGSDEDTGELIASFVATLVEILTEGRSFPLLDSASAELARSMEVDEGVQVSPGSMTRGAEISSAVAFMGYLPSFERLGIDEILDLRKSLRDPLLRFRGAIATLSKNFEARPIDEAFDDELEDAWRREVAPALAEIRESLAEHGLLREAASVALGDPRRLMVEAGGIFAAAHAPLLSLSELATASAAIGVPIVDVMGQALAKRIESRRQARKNAFFFLHGIEEAL